jgi:hypothetical protein
VLDANDGFVASSWQDSENEHIFVSNFGDHAFVWDNVELSAKLSVGDIEICVEREFNNDGAHFSAGNIDITLANNSERSSRRAFATRAPT